MPIPELDENGLLPAGVYDCTMEEIQHRFGGFVHSNQRPVLFARLQEFMTELKASGLAVAAIIDGSFTTAKEKTTNAPPNDIDLMVILPKDHDMTAVLRPFQYNVVSHRRVERRYGLDLKTAMEDSGDHREYMELYSKVRGRPDLRKGCLRVAL